jgi:hypothetical protein
MGVIAKQFAPEMLSSLVRGGVVEIPQMVRVDFENYQGSETEKTFLDDMEKVRVLKEIAEDPGSDKWTYHCLYSTCGVTQKQRSNMKAHFRTSAHNLNEQHAEAFYKKLVDAGKEYRCTREAPGGCELCRTRPKPIGIKQSSKKRKY